QVSVNTFNGDVFYHQTGPFSQAGRRGFDPLLPLFVLSILKHPPGCSVLPMYSIETALGHSSFMFTPLQALLVLHPHSRDQVVTAALFEHLSFEAFAAVFTRN